MSKATTLIMIKEVEGSKKPALIAESENICLRNVKDLVTTITGIILIKTIIETTIITGDGIITMVVNKIRITKITGIIALFNNNSSNNSRTVTIRLTIFR